MRQRTAKRIAECLKDREQFQNRLVLSHWNNAKNGCANSPDWKFRLGLLATIQPGQTMRQTFNLTKLNYGGINGRK